MTHPYVLHAVTALHSLHRAADHLADARDAIVIRRPQLGPAATRPRSLAALHAHDELLRAERRDRTQLLREGTQPAGTIPAPITPGLLDLDRDLQATVEHVTLLVASALYRRPLLAYSRDWLTTIPGDGRWTYLAAALPHIGWHLAREVHRDLDTLDRRLRAVIGLDPDRWPLPGAPPCPACGRRTLAAQTSAGHSAMWTITCDSDACTCLGRRCTCAMTSRPTGIRHIWTADAPVMAPLLQHPAA